MKEVCNDNNGCTVDLDEENFGNYGIIKAKTFTHTGSAKSWDSNGPETYSTGLKCYQCEGWEENVRKSSNHSYYMIHIILPEFISTVQLLERLLPRLWISWRMSQH